MPNHLQPKGLHPENAKNVKAKNLDQTIETKEESEKEGVQGKEVYLKIKFNDLLYVKLKVA